MRKGKGFTELEVKDSLAAFEISLKRIIVDLACVRLQENHHIFIRVEVRRAKHEHLNA